MRQRRLLPFSAALGALLASSAIPLRVEAQGGLPQVTEARLISISSRGAAANGTSHDPSLSIDGGFAAFVSEATNLLPLDEDRISDVYLSDVEERTLTLVSIGEGIPGGVAPKGNGPSWGPSASAKGARVLFVSDATNLSRIDRNRFTDVYLRDVARSETVYLSVSERGEAGDDASDAGVLSSNGEVAAFQSLATNLVEPSVRRGLYRIHVRPVGRGTMTRIGPPDGKEPDGDSRAPDLSGDGGLVAFESAASNLVPPDVNKVMDIFVHDMATGETRLVSVAEGGRQLGHPSQNPRISDDGRFVAFESLSPDLVPLDRNRVQDVFVVDLRSGHVERASLDIEGQETPFPSSLGDLSADGRFVTFMTEAPLVPQDDNKLLDVYMRDLQLSRTTLVSAADTRVGLRAGNGPSDHGVTSGDGQFHALDSMATDLAPEQPAARPGVYRMTLPQVEVGTFPPSNHILLHIDRLIQQFDLAGRKTGVLLEPAGALGGIAVDELNAVWILGPQSISMLSALSLRPTGPAGAGLFPLPREILGRPQHGLVAMGGFAWGAAGNVIFRVSADGEFRFRELPGPSQGVLLALDPPGNLWVSSMSQAVNDVLRLSRDLEILHVTRRAGNDPFLAMACDPAGGLLVRSRRSLRRFSRAGGEVWSAPVGEGGGLAVDGSGQVFTVAGDQILGFRPNGRRFLRAQVRDIGPIEGAVAMSIDGEGRVHFAPEGGRAAFFLDLADPPPIVPRNFAAGLVGAHAGGDTTGFVAANVTAQMADSDEDGFQNRAEIEEGFNPFDPGRPRITERLPPVLDLTATLVAPRTVRLDWTSSVPYERFFVFRDGRQIPGSPFPFAVASRGVTDTGIPGGVHEYRVIGQGLVGGRGGGAGFDPGSEGIDEPYSFSEGTVISQGEGLILRHVEVSPPPLAVAHDTASNNVFVVLDGGTLLTLDENLDLLDDSSLPLDPFASSEVRGLTIDVGDAARPLYFLLADGAIYRRVGAGAPGFHLQLTGFAPAEEGFSGLAVVRVNGNDLFTTMAGPGVDCLIGFLRTSGVVMPGADSTLSSVLGFDVIHSVGLAPIGSLLLAGVGYDAEVAPPTIQRVVELGVGANFSITDEGASVSLGQLASDDISGFAYAPGLGLLVADRAGSRVALLEATFPGSLQVLSITPSAGPRHLDVQNVDIAGTGFGQNVADLEVRLGDSPVAIKSLQAGVIRVDVPALGTARQVEVQVSN
ncbi:MAG TPA: IPT/TIG domain-containing protein, partial [Planctomycetota bacterium]|nr:IPT/TIG domain-containing protein [Planctomycetota bacterium]